MQIVNYKDSELMFDTQMSSSTFLDMDAAEDNSDYEMDFDNGITRTGLTKNYL